MNNNPFDQFDHLPQVAKPTGTFGGLGETIKENFKIGAKGLGMLALDHVPTDAKIAASNTKEQTLFDDFAAKKGTPEADAALKAYMEKDGVIGNGGHLLHGVFDLFSGNKQTPDALVDNSKHALKESIHKSEQHIAQHTPDDLNIFQKGVRGAIDSGARMIPGIGLEIAARGRLKGMGMTSLAGGQTYSDSYGKARANGKTPEQAHDYAKVDALLEMGGEAAPAMIFVSLFKKQGDGALKQALKRMLVADVAGEQVTTLGQSLNALDHGLDKELENAETIQEKLAIQGERQAVAAVSAALLSGTLGGVGVAAQKLQGQQNNDDNHDSAVNPHNPNLPAQLPINPTPEPTAQTQPTQAPQPSQVTGNQHWDNIKHHLVNAAQKVGVDAGTMAMIAHFESGFNTNAAPIAKNQSRNKIRQHDGRMAISSAHGLGQFLDATWHDYINKYGAKYGIQNAERLTKAEAAQYRNDVGIQAAMLAEFTRDNVQRGRTLGGQDDIANVYALHNLGSGDGAAFLKALRNNPTARVNGILSQDVIRGNPSLYGNGNISIAEAYQRMGKKMRSGEKYAVDAQRMAGQPTAINDVLALPNQGQQPSINDVLALPNQGQQPSVNDVLTLPNQGQQPSINNVLALPNPQSKPPAINDLLALPNQGQQPSINDVLTLPNQGQQPSVNDVLALPNQGQQPSVNDVLALPNPQSKPPAINPLLGLHAPHTPQPMPQAPLSQTPQAQMQAFEQANPMMNPMQGLSFDEFGKTTKPPVTQQKRRATGQTDIISTPTGREVSVSYEIRELDDLIASNDEHGNINPNFPQALQPRDRTRQSSLNQINEIAHQFKPRLLMASPTTDTGSPIINHDGVVESGNGRTLALSQVYQRLPDKAEHYKKVLKEKGFNINGFKKPVLVRVRDTEMDINERAAFAKESNNSQVLSLSITEQSKQDAPFIDEQLLSTYQGGDLSLEKNKGFVSGFMQRLPSSDRSSMVDKNGHLSKQGKERIEAAIFMAAYSDEKLLAEFFESTDDTIKRLGNVLLDVSAKWLFLRNLAKEGYIEPSVDITSNLVEAAHIILTSKKEGKTVYDLVGQGDLLTGQFIAFETEALLRLFYKGNNYKTMRSRDSIYDSLYNYVIAALQVTKKGATLTGVKNVTTTDILNHVLKQAGKDDHSQNPISRSIDQNRTTGQGLISRGSRQETTQNSAAIPTTEPSSPTKTETTEQTTTPPAVAFNATHELDTGELVIAHHEESGVWIDEQGDEYIGDATPIKTSVKQSTTKEQANVPSTQRDMERDSDRTEHENGTVPSSVQAGRRHADGDHRQASERTGSDVQPVDHDNVSDVQPTTGRTDSDQRVDEQAAQSHDQPVAERIARDIDGGRSNRDSNSGRSVHDSGKESRATNDVPKQNTTGNQSKRSLSLAEKVKQQEKVEDVDINKTDLANIRETLPVLMKEQQEDVEFAEQRFENGRGVLFTNGTGTGKTYTGLGLVKRFQRMGKDNILIIAPTDKVIKDWIESGENLLLEINQLKSVSEHGDKGITITTYANFQQNETLVHREWDLLVFDESHKINQNQAGKSTNAQSMFRTLAGIAPYKKAYLLKKPQWDALKQKIKTYLTEKQNESTDTIEKARNVPALAELIGHEKTKETFKKQIEKLTGEEREIKLRLEEYDESRNNKTVFLSATPFAYQKSLQYADGFLFDSGQFEDKGKQGGYNVSSGFDSFLEKNLGYEMKYGRLQKSSGDFNDKLGERNINKMLKDAGALRGRRLKVDQDYSRDFVLIDGGIGKKIDEGFQFLQDNHEKYGELSEQLRKKFDYMTRLQVLESIKAEAATERIRQHHALGRKVVVFHDYKKGAVVAPFSFVANEHTSPALINEFKAERPDLANLVVGGLSVPNEIKAQFPDAIIFNGDIPKKTRNKGVKDFNNDALPDANLIVIQRQAGKEGISLHDRTGKFQRAQLDLGLPTRPTDAIQSEGRIYRTGLKSDAVIEYFTTGLDYENHTFSEGVAQRSSTAENLALGHDARNLLLAFSDAYNNASDFKPSLSQGKGGKVNDNKLESDSFNVWDEALNAYYGKAKTKGRRDQREGNDFYATPEPVGFKMAEWLYLNESERALEPSAGDGAIARWLPNDADNTFVEKSYSLAGKLGLLGNGEVKNQDFESLSTVNKYHGIAMNPPFGSGGKLAIEHVEKAIRHLKDGGRVIALIPRGGMADKRFDKMIEDLKDDIYFTHNITLPSSTFERAGTKVNTRIVVFDRLSRKERERLNLSKDSFYTDNLTFDHIASNKALFKALEDVQLNDRFKVTDTDKEKPAFSIKPETSPPIAQVELNTVVDRISAAWRNAPDIVTVAHFDGLPLDIIEAAYEQGAKLSDIHAVYHQKKVYLVADKFSSAKEVEQALFHEVLGHYGTRQLFGDAFQQNMNDLYQQIGGKKGFEQLLDQYGLTDRLKTYQDGSRLLNAKQRNALLMDELLAHIAEKETGTLKQKALEILGAIRKWLSDHGFIELAKLNAADLAHVLKQARETITQPNQQNNTTKTKGKKPYPNTRFSIKNTDNEQLWQDEPTEPQGMQKAKEAGKKILDWAKNKTDEFSKNGGLGLLTLRQLVDIANKTLPASEAYLKRVEQMLTERNDMQHEAAQVAKRWQALPKLVQRRLASLMHDATLEGVDAAQTQFETSDVLIHGGMDAVKADLNMDISAGFNRAQAVTVKATQENLTLLARRKNATWRKFKNARNPETVEALREQAHKEQTEWELMRNALKRDRVRAKAYPLLHKKFQSLPDEAQAIYKDARDMYRERSTQMEQALIDQLDYAQLNKQAKKAAVLQIRSDFENARLQGVYFPLFRKGNYFVRSKRKRNDIAEDEFQIYTPLVTINRKTKQLSLNPALYKTMPKNQQTEAELQKLLLSKKAWPTKEDAEAAIQQRNDLKRQQDTLEVKQTPDGYVIIDSAYESVFQMVQTAREAEQLSASLKQEGLKDVKHGKLEKHNLQDALPATHQFYADLMQTLDKKGVDSKVQDDIHQLYLAALPELSQRKNFIHRKKTAGFSDNALMAFAQNMTHQAHQISKMKARDALEEQLNQIKQQARDVDQANAMLAGNLRDELISRHDWVMNPKNASWTTWTSSFGFVMYLGLSPAAALVNLTQTAVVAYPVLAAEFGANKAGKMLLNTLRELNAKDIYKRDYQAIKRDHLSKDEQQALEQFYQMGVLDRSEAHMLAGIGDTDSLQASPKYQQAMSVIGRFFHNAEVINREVTALAAYRLAKEKGKADPVGYAANATWESHFDYSNANRAAFMQGDFAKLFLMFKSYSQHMIYFMVRNARLAGKGDKKAQVKLMGTLAMTLAMGGVSAMPAGIVGTAVAHQYLHGKYDLAKANAAIGAGVGVALLASVLLSDDDEPFDWVAEIRAWLRGVGGNTLETFVMDGAVNAASGLDLSSRISLNGLIVREPDRDLDSQEQWQHYLSQTLGAVVGYGASLARSADLASDGQYYRALEKAAPKFVRDPMRAARYSQEGVTNRNGNPILDKDLASLGTNDINLWNVFWQANGFNPAKLSRQYQENTSLKNYEKFHSDRRQRLLNRYALAFIERDDAAFNQTIDDVQRYNQSISQHNPAAQISIKHLKSSIRMRIRNKYQNDNGVLLRKNQRFLHELLNTQ